MHNWGQFISYESKKCVQWFGRHCCLPKPWQTNVQCWALHAMHFFPWVGGLEPKRGRYPLLVQGWTWEQQRDQRTLCFGNLLHEVKEDDLFQVVEDIFLVFQANMLRSSPWNKTSSSPHKKKGKKNITKPGEVLGHRICLRRSDTKDAPKHWRSWHQGFWPPLGLTPGGLTWSIFDNFDGKKKGPGFILKYCSFHFSSGLWSPFFFSPGCFFWVGF